MPNKKIISIVSGYNIKELLSILLPCAKNAGDSILQVYNSDFAVEQKDDKSPLTLADKNSHEIIYKHLKGTNIPILSEEGRNIPFNERSDWEYFWLIDPLDGTKEFIKRNGEFTVNIALIHNGRPELGVVYAPVKDTYYFSAPETGAYRITPESCKKQNNGNDHFTGNIDDILRISEKLPVKSNAAASPEFVVVASRSHMNKETEEFIDDLKSEHENIKLISAGSSLKLCLVAEGNAHVYPRLAPTMEWDTAAAHAVVNGAGKKVVDHSTGNELIYNKPDLLNPWFVVR